MNKNPRTTQNNSRPAVPGAGETPEEDKNPFPRHYPYEKFFAGYDIYSSPRRRGIGRKIVREYKGPLYRQNLTSRQAVQLRILYVFLFLAALAFMIAALCLKTASNYSWYVMVSALFYAVFYARLLIALNDYVWSKRDLKEYEYQHGAKVLQVRTKSIMSAAFVPIAATIVMFFLQPGSFSALELLRAAMLIISGVLSLLIGRIEKKVEYTEIK